MKSFATAVVGLTFAFSMTAQALAVDVSGNSSAQAGANTTGSVEADVYIGTSASTGASGSGDEQGAEASASGNGKAETTVQVGPIVLTRADVSLESDTRAKITVPGAVKTNADLSVYASSVFQADENVSAVASADTEVSLGYKQRAKLFGFIPMFVTATASVASDGKVRVSHPWYAFLATTDSASLKSDVEAATQATLSQNGGADAKFSAAVQAQLLAEIHGAMKSNLQATLAAEGSAGATAQ